MRIAQIAPLAESIPPKLYGGRVVAWLVEQLVDFGHDVTLFASGERWMPLHIDACHFATIARTAMAVPLLSRELARSAAEPAHRTSEKA
jgi:hypothetical protein